MHVVGLTGGIGSGKSALAGELAALGVPVIDADAVARRCVEPGGDVLPAIVERFGADVLAPDGTLDRGALAAIVFADDEARLALEALTHPCIRAGIADELAALGRRADPPAVVVVEHPLLVESGATATVDTVVVVEAPSAQRVARLVEERGMTVEDARARIAAQADDATRRAAADVLVHNDGPREALAGAARDLLARLVATGEGR